MTGFLRVEFAAEARERLATLRRASLYVKHR
jgi:hypothetical protein